MTEALTVVVVEDSEILRSMVASRLRRQGHQVHAVVDAEAVDRDLGGVHPDLYLLDVTLPGEDGFALARRLRAAEPNVGIVMVTGRTAVDDRVTGYAAGADAYLSKPIVFEELDAIILAVARRVRPGTDDLFVLDAVTGVLRGPAGEAHLPAGQVAMLEGLARASDRTLTSPQLINLLGHDPAIYRKASLEVQIVRLRERLIAVGAAADALLAIRGVGYRLTLDLKVRRVLAGG